jgi:hypothetical protein
MEWQNWAEGAGIMISILTIVGIGVAQGKRQGTQEEKIKDILKAIGVLSECSDEHTIKLAEGSSNFKVIDAKLDGIKESIVGMKDLLFRHIFPGGKE